LKADQVAGAFKAKPHLSARFWTAATEAAKSPLWNRASTRLAHGGAFRCSMPKRRLRRLRRRSPKRGRADDRPRIGGAFEDVPQLELPASEALEFRRRPKVTDSMPGTDRAPPQRAASLESTARSGTGALCQRVADRMRRHRSAEFIPLQVHSFNCVVKAE